MTGQRETYVVNIKTFGLELARELVAIGEATYIGRAYRGFPESKWGNRYHIGPDGSREDVIEKWLADLVENEELLTAIVELRAQVLLCWCKPLACHGDILAEMANSYKEPSS